MSRRGETGGLFGRNELHRKTAGCFRVYQENSNAVSHHSIRTEKQPVKVEPRQFCILSSPLHETSRHDTETQCRGRCDSGADGGGRSEWMIFRGTEIVEQTDLCSSSRSSRFSTSAANKHFETNAWRR
ncbi:hypothetical protein TNIN_212811 [Trichonephila inaurata madagascariensis]|uniref:Uncharacterized protein n=1 Tax=Trichonephila inaurata madagascariensis TaxID=2747483 RepID=A0A8X6WU43_9ARAC|nr:hypothetical protein TNIN_212811 [Trichonephila inaurata madagascariensis]